MSHHLIVIRQVAKGTAKIIADPERLIDLVEAAQIVCKPVGTVRQRKKIKSILTVSNFLYAQLLHLLVIASLFVQNLQRWKQNVFKLVVILFRICQNYY